VPDETPTVVVAGSGFPSLEIERGILQPLGVTLVDGNGLTAAELERVCCTASAVMTDYYRWDADRIRGLGRCRVICQYGVGLDQIDIDAASRAGIYVTHTPSYCVDELADHTVALILAVARRIVHYDRLVHSGRWDYNDGMPMRRLKGRTLGLLGFGQAARAVAQRARGFGVRIVAHDPLVDPAQLTAAGVEPVSLGQLLDVSEILSIHVPLTPETEHLIGAAELRRLTDGAILVNTARGGIVDQEALAAELRSGRLGGAGLDVLELEPPDTSEPLLSCEGAVITPHAAFLSVESLRSVQQQAAEEVARVLAGHPPAFAVNADQIPNQPTGGSSNVVPTAAARAGGTT
jgi:D-3-phosphoglycerate dehydrogenase